MKVELKEITIREVAYGYEDNDEEGVVGYDGKLDICPKYQREFVYDEKKRNAVIDTIRKVFPLNVMYWVVTDEGTYEVMACRTEGIRAVDLGTSRSFADRFADPS